MQFIRVFAQQTYYHNWVGSKPQLETLLRCFDVKREGTTSAKSVSVFSAASALEELDAAAAHFQTTSRTAETQYGLLVTEDDCNYANLTIENKPGRTGICSVDQRHVDLSGEIDAFVDLVGRIVQRLWEGEQRLRCFPARSIVGQIAVFSKLEISEIGDESRGDCEMVLSKDNAHRFEEDGTKVVLSGTLEDKLSTQTISAYRTILRR